MLNKIEVAIGKYRVKFFFLIKISPGSFPTKGILSKNTIIKPSNTIAMPVKINIFPND